MAKVSTKQRELRKQRTVEKYAEKRQALKEKINDRSLSPEETWDALQALNKLPRNASPSRLRNRCQITGRPHGYLRKFGLCRNKLRQLAMQGDVPGLVKASW
jgi:small subunit ribosomal protein S14